MKLIRLLLLPVFLGFFSLAVLAEPVNINTADAPTIAKQLKGVGLKKAQAIVEYRKAHGDFKTIDDLANVKGIGLSTVSKNRDNMVVKNQK